MKILDVCLPYLKKFIEAPLRRKIWISSRLAGKSFAVSILAAFKALQKTNGLSLIVSTGARAASELLRKVVAVAQAVEVLSKGKIYFTSSADCVKFNNGSRVLSLPSGNPAALRGTTASCVIIDEAAWIEHLDRVLAAIAPTLTRLPDGELCLVSTPAGKNTEFYRLWQDTLDSDDWYTQRTSIYDAVNDGLNVDIDELKKLCPDPDIWNMEYGAEFLDQFGSFIDVSLLEYLDDCPKTKSCYAGFDIARTGDKSAIVDVALLTDGSYFVRDIVMLSKMKYDEQIDIFKQLYSLKQWHAGFVDAVGIGGPIAETLHDKVSVKIRPYTWSSSNKTPAYEYLRSLIFDHKLKFASHLKQLVETDFANISRVVAESGQVKFVALHTSAGHSDAASALVLALLAAKTNPVSLSTPICRPFNSAFGARTSIFG